MLVAILPSCAAVHSLLQKTSLCIRLSAKSGIVLEYICRKYHGMRPLLTGVFQFYRENLYLCPGEFVRTSSFGALLTSQSLSAVRAQSAAIPLQCKRLKLPWRVSHAQTRMAHCAKDSKGCRTNLAIKVKRAHAHAALVLPLSRGYT